METESGAVTVKWQNWRSFRTSFLQFCNSAILQWMVVVAVAAMVGYASWRDGRPTGRRDSPAVVAGRLGSLATSREGLEARVRAMDARLAERPDDVDAAVLLADALLRQTRVVGNPGLALRAEGVIKQALREDPGHYGANRMLGSLYLSQHRFREAIWAARRNRDARPNDPINDGVIGDAHLELGEYDEAFDAFNRMMRRRPSAAAYARVAYARELQGNLTGALEAMKLAADATSAPDVEGIAWHQSQVGELLLQIGRVHEAKEAFAAASQAFPGHPFAVMGYARAVEAEGDVVGAITLLRELAGRAPTPDAFARLGELLERQGENDEAARFFARAEAAWRSEAPEPKSLARFLADRGVKIDEAVRIAERASADRDDIFTNDALAWSLFKANRVEEARKAIARALRTGTRDRTIREHARAIAPAAQHMVSHR